MTLSQNSKISKTAHDTVMMLRAFEVAKSSDDPKAKIFPLSGVGAVIEESGVILSESSNKIVPSIRSDYKITDPSSQDRYHYIEHAERCAIYNSINEKVSILGATMYCTRFPCIDCARSIAFVGIKRLVVPTGFDGESRWLDAQRAALTLFRLSDVTLRYFDPR